MEKTELHTHLNDLLALVDHSVQLQGGQAQVVDPARLRQTVHRLAEVSVMESGARQGYARYLVWLAAQALGIYPASIHELYMARGKEQLPTTFTVPAMNMRALSYDAACAAFAAARAIDAAAFIFEIARSEMGYTDQRPAEYVTNMLAAAITEGYTGPVFIQGDHFQFSGKRYASNAEAEVKAVRDLIKEAIQAGFYNIDIDASTLVDLSKSSLEEQQALNTRLSAEMTALIRQLEPEGVTVSVGGEIGEVGGHNSTEPELRAYMDGYVKAVNEIAPGKPGMSKISIQTGTSHGGVVLPDGTIADVSVDFETLRHLSQIARQEYGLGGAVQHGASTLPESAFSKFVESEAIEVHLATNFQTMLYDRLPEELRNEMYAWLDVNNANERKPGMTDGVFYYKQRKNALGPFKKQLWSLPAANREEIRQAWEEQFSKLFVLLGLTGTRQFVQQTITPVLVQPDLKFYLGDAAGEEDVSDLAD